MTTPDGEVRGPFAWDRARYERYVNSGGVEGNTIGGKRVVILSTTDAATGRVRRSPLMRVKHGDDYAVIGSRGGDDEHPAWYRDVLEHPLVQLQDGMAKSVYRAREAVGRERDVWWQRAVEAWPIYAEDQMKTTRVIPVVLLTPEA